MVAVLSKELVEMERDFWQAMVDRDWEFCRRAMADDVLVVSAQGIMGKEEILAMLADPRGRMVKYHTDEPTVRELSDDSALLSYRAQMTGEYDGKQMEMDIYASTIYVFRHGQWLAAFHQETPVQPMMGA